MRYGARGNQGMKLRAVLFLLAMSPGLFWAAPGEPLFVPELLEGALRSDGARGYRLTVREGGREFLPGAETPTLGYNGDYLGPTLLLRRGERVAIEVDNTLSEPTTVHWHGAHLPAEADGGPRQPIAAGGGWTARFTVTQPAATLWYHPHMMGTTAEQVYRGLAGFILIEDDAAQAELPDEYGVDDVPLVFQERRFDADGRFRYRPAMPDIMHGYAGNAMLVNGGIEPVFEARTRLLRLRLLNGSNSTVLRLSLGGEADFIQIGSDGGLLNAPLDRSEIVLSPGERVEVLLDLTGREGREIPLVTETHMGERYTAMRIRTASRLRSNGRIPGRLAQLPPPGTAAGLDTRPFVMSTMGPGGRLTINGRSMDMGRIDERVRLGGAEIWEVSSVGMMMNTPHNFHVHGLQFRILSLNGAPAPDHLAGLKDTVLLWPGDRIRIRLEFRDYTGIYMYHCHMLEHEDAGMMGQYEVTAGGRG